MNPTNPSRFVSKFGGSSLAGAGQLRKVRSIIDADSRRRIIVPSAPGKRDNSDTKITDLLYLCHHAAQLGADFSSSFSRIVERFTGLESELGVDAGLAQQLEQLRADLQRGVSVDHAASRGEYLCGRLLAAWLDAEFVDPVDCVVISANGLVEPETWDLLGQRLADPERRYVLPGFYGRDAEGRVRTFTRGGSDVTGAVAARAAGAELYENWTDVSGLLMADPRIVDSPRPMAEVTYAEIREMAYMGASVLHDEAMAPVREVGIPVNIRNTNAPDHPGTRIVAQLSAETLSGTQIAGVAGKDNFAMITVGKNLMNREVGFVYRLLGVLEHNDIPFEHCPSSIDSVSVIVEARWLEDRAEQLMDEIRRTLEPDEIDYVPRIALIAIVGEEMAHTPGIAARVFGALAKGGINVRLINQGASELNIIVGVAAEDYAAAVQAIYGEFVG
ncbi:aspartate kinase [Parahaliea aestuarii]|uniref:Aspartokinase n=1 Tax=Parahaliea aestuarii TaxID=1852021 RepID=A0A5C8ZYL4_9GAMM|nr:aspartate kinase [Parahaliea aestuarii]TXS93568.1 aspartate kinase [Parahaliea aestuarii]